MGNFAREMPSLYASQLPSLFAHEVIVAGIEAATRMVLTFGLFLFVAAWTVVWTYSKPMDILRRTLIWFSRANTTASRHNYSGMLAPRVKWPLCL